MSTACLRGTNLYTTSEALVRQLKLTSGTWEVYLFSERVARISRQNLKQFSRLDQLARGIGGYKRIL